MYVKCSSPSLPAGAAGLEIGGGKQRENTPPLHSEQLTPAPGHAARWSARPALAALMVATRLYRALVGLPLTEQQKVRAHDSRG